jgi:hypothetical protein
VRRSAFFWRRFLVRRIVYGGLGAAVLTATFGLATPAFAQADQNCSDFATQPEAQAVFDQDPSDPSDLDRDDDSIACESLPGGRSPVTDDDDAPRETPRGAVDAGFGGAAEDGLPPMGPSAAVAAGALLTTAGTIAIVRRRRSQD